MNGTIVHFNRIEHRRVGYYATLDDEQLAHLQTLTPAEMANNLEEFHTYHCESDEPINIEDADWIYFNKNNKRVTLLDEQDDGEMFDSDYKPPLTQEQLADVAKQMGAQFTLAKADPKTLIDFIVSYADSIREEQE